MTGATCRAAAAKALVVICMAAAGFPGPLAGEEGTASGTVAALQDLEALRREITERYVEFEKAQEPSEENGHSYGQYYRNLYDPNRNPRLLTLGRLETFERLHRGTQAGLGALLDILGAARLNGPVLAEKLPTCAELLLERYAGFEEAGEICYLGNLWGDGERYSEFLDRLIRATPHRSVKARATVMKMITCQALGKDLELGEAMGRLLGDYGEETFRGTPCEELVRDWRLPPLEPEALDTGKAAPELSGRDLDGKPVRLSDFRGRVVVLVFFGWW